MPDVVYILWLPVAITFMAVTWVFTLGALGHVRAPAEEPAVQPSRPGIDARSDH